jgi:hypothetical protein
MSDIDKEVKTIKQLADASYSGSVDAHTQLFTELQSLFHDENKFKDTMSALSKVDGAKGIQVVRDPKTNQAEYIEFPSASSTDMRTDIGFAKSDTFYVALQGSMIDAKSNSTVFAAANSTVFAEGGSTVFAGNQSDVHANQESHVTAGAGSTVTADKGSDVIADNGSKVIAEPGSKYEARDGSRVIAMNDSTGIAGAGSVIVAEAGAKIKAGTNAKIYANPKAKIDSEGTPTIILEDGSTYKKGNFLDNLHLPVKLN